MISTVTVFYNEEESINQLVQLHLGEPQRGMIKERFSPNPRRKWFDK
jgi:hypothetical protein